MLLILLAAEFGASALPLAPSVRPLVLVRAVLMVAAVGTMFMQVNKGPMIVRLFVAAGLLWLSILLGLGSLDPMTRTDVYVQGINPSQPVWESISRARGPRVVSVSLLMRCHATFLIIPRSR